MPDDESRGRKHKDRITELNIYVASNDQSLNLQTDESYVLEIEAPTSSLSVNLKLGIFLVSFACKLQPTSCVCPSRDGQFLHTSGFSMRICRNSVEICLLPMGCMATGLRSKASDKVATQQMYKIAQHYPQFTNANILPGVRIHKVRHSH